MAPTGYEGDPDKPQEQTVTSPDQTKCWREHELDSAVEDIAKSDFVAIDLEFSGLFTHYQKHFQLQQYYEYCADSISKFLVVQLGICAVRRSQMDPNLWIFSPYNFHCFPSQRRIFTSDSQTLQWLLSCGFNFANWISQGFDYWRLQSVQCSGTSKYAYRNVPKNIKTLGVQRVIEAVVEYERPVVVHNGLLDMLHIYDKFIGEKTPKLAGEFAMEWRRLFTGGTFDTKHMAQEGKYKVLNIADTRATSLEGLRSHLLKSPFLTKFALCANRLESGRLTDYTLSPLPADQCHHKSHEAGFDAMATAQTFLLELERYFASSRIRNNLDEPVIPFDWKESTVGRRFSDHVEVCVSPGQLDLRELAEKVEVTKGTLGAPSVCSPVSQAPNDIFDASGSANRSNSLRARRPRGHDELVSEPTLLTSPLKRPKTAVGGIEDPNAFEPLTMPSPSLVSTASVEDEDVRPLDTSIAGTIRIVAPN